MRWIWVLLVLMPGLVWAGDLFENGYTIGNGDVLEISVWKEAALTKQVAVLPDGTIRFPLVGELAAAGRTVSSLKKEIEEKISPYVPEPELSMSVMQVNSMMVYVIGKVNKPGRLVLNTQVDVLQALAMAGGLNPFAKEKKIRIYRKKKEETRQFPFNYEDVAEGVNLEQNIVLERGDVIVVP